ncbi:MAG: DUF1311 domain-containing protein [Alteromonadaceae bacterium]|nr:DUF1311 domain-containing protein [Alteromonadaceae bacterium]
MSAVPGFIRYLAFLGIALFSSAGQAIDNPDAHKYLENFRAEASSYEQAIYEDAQTTSDSIEAYHDYIEFLEETLAAAVFGLNAELPASEREAFKDAQAAWEAYREVEKAFVANVWTPQNFGSSSSFSRLTFYAEVIRSRIELVQKYRMQF